MGHNRNRIQNWVHYTLVLYKICIASSKFGDHKGRECQVYGFTKYTISKILFTTSKNLNWKPAKQDYCLLNSVAKRTHKDFLLVQLSHHFTRNLDIPRFILGRRETGLLHIKCFPNACQLPNKMLQKACILFH